MTTSHEMKSHPAWARVVLGQDRPCDNVILLAKPDWHCPGMHHSHRSSPAIDSLTMIPSGRRLFCVLGTRLED
jgi:hypothetical protein